MHERVLSCSLCPRASLRSTCPGTFGAKYITIIAFYLITLEFQSPNSKFRMTMAAYPSDHGLAHARVMRVFDLIAAHPDISDVEVVGQLVTEGINPVDAELLIRFVPSAMAYATLKRMGATCFFDIYMVRTESGRVKNLPLAKEHYFTAALAWAEQLLTTDPTARPVSLEAFNAVISRSSAMHLAANSSSGRAAARRALRGAAISPLVLHGITLEQIVASRREHRRTHPWWRFWG